MKKKVSIFFFISLAVAILGLFVYPHLTFQTEDKLIACRYSDDISEFETEISPDECYVYCESRDITWSSFDFEKFGPFYVLSFDIEEGNTIQSKYALDPAYIDDFLANASIEVVEKNYKEIHFTTDDVATLLSNKKQLNTINYYTCPDYDMATKIYYQLGDASNIMFLYEIDEILVVQVGYPDEGPKFIAYA